MYIKRATDAQEYVHYGDYANLTSTSDLPKCLRFLRPVHEMKSWSSAETLAGLAQCASLAVINPA
jgi:hypothetical protein